ncbi:hypothetical protein [Pandoraea sp. ISTKB]|uniref:hypothetical protein n=1 Tax=Pandoraea sp. ISTKB TaxID=1586708 RepID=UPI001112EDB4|nr:hypothetical protein [Pandoraea sp. ISTKB]
MRKTYGRVLHWLIAPALEYAGIARLPCAKDIARDDPYVALLRKALSGRTSKISVVELLDDVLELPTSRRLPSEIRRVSRAMSVLGWRRVRESAAGGGWAYQPGH